MAANTKVLLEKGTGKTVQASEIEIPDLWHIAMYVKRCMPNGEVNCKDILTVWHNAHAMREHIVNH